MYPITLDTSRLTFLLIGKGASWEKRLSQLQEASARMATTLEEADIVLVTGMDEAASSDIAARAKKAGKLVNVEDKKHLSDFHIPALVRRGDLLLTASTGGKSPALARRLRQWLEEKFSNEWQDRVALLAKKRKEWQEAGCSFEELKHNSDSLIEKENWLR